MKSSENDKTGGAVFSHESTLTERNASDIQGVIKVHESVVASIIRKAACSVDGVLRLAGNTLVDNIAEFVGSKKVMDRAIAIEMGENTVSVEIKVVLAFGCRIPEVAGRIQTEVIDNITRITGMQVERIDIIVTDLEDAEPEEEEADTDPQ